MATPLGDLTAGDWFAWDHGFAVLLESRTVHVRIATFTAEGVLKQVKTAAKVTTVDFQCSEARNVPWRRP